MKSVLCIGCGSRIALHEELQVGDTVTCEECGEQFEIVNLNPPEIEWLYEYDVEWAEEPNEYEEGEEEYEGEYEEEYEEGYEDEYEEEYEFGHS